MGATAIATLFLDRELRIVRFTESARNRAWEAEGLLDLIVGLEAGATR